MCTLLKYAKNVAVTYLHKTDMPVQREVVLQPLHC